MLGPGALLGHTADDRAETLLINLLRGAGAPGCSAMGPHPTRPILALRRARDPSACTHLGLIPVADPTNDDARFVRNRIRHEVLPLLDDVAGRDVVPLLIRTADVLAADGAAARRGRGPVATDDARVLAALPGRAARRSFVDGCSTTASRPDRAGLERVLAVAAGGHAPASSPAAGGSNDTASAFASSDRVAVS